MVKNGAVQRFDERQQKFPAGKRLALVREIRAVFQIAKILVIGKAFAGKKCPVPEVLSRDRRFAHRCDGDLVDLCDRQLCFGIECADRVDRVAKELDAGGRTGVGRPDVDDAAANRELARAEQRLFAHVTAGKKSFDQRLGRKVGIAAKHAAHSGDRRGRNGALYQRAGRHHDKPGIRPTHLPEGECPPFLGLGVRRGTRIRVDLKRRQGDDAVPAAGIVRQVADPRFHLAV